MSNIFRYLRTKIRLGLLKWLYFFNYNWFIFKIVFRKLKNWATTFLNNYFLFLIELVRSYAGFREDTLKFHHRASGTPLPRKKKQVDLSQLCRKKVGCSGLKEFWTFWNSEGIGMVLPFKKVTIEKVEVVRQKVQSTEINWSALSTKKDAQFFKL